MTNVMAMTLKSIRKRGVLATVAVILGELEFRLRHGVDTGGHITLAGMDVKGGNRQYGADYQAVSATLFKRVFRSLRQTGHIDPGTTCFVDVGCGKGRPLVLALGQGFRRLIGVEFNAELLAVAEANFAQLAAAGQLPKGAHCQFVHEDAAEWAIPDEACVIFLFNPFGSPVINQVARNISVSVQKNPRSIVVVYINPLHDRVFREEGFTAILDLRPDATAYQCCPDCSGTPRRTDIPGSAS